MCAILLPFKDKAYDQQRQKDTHANKAKPTQLRLNLVVWVVQPIKCLWKSGLSVKLPWQCVNDLLSYRFFAI
jgi:hypothetical protein